MTTQSTIDRIQRALNVLTAQKSALLLGDAGQPTSYSVQVAEGYMRTVCEALDAIALEYDATDFSLAKAVDDMGWSQAAINADERLEQVRR